MVPGLPRCFARESSDGHQSHKARKPQNQTTLGKASRQADLLIRRRRLLVNSAALGGLTIAILQVAETTVDAQSINDGAQSINDGPRSLTREAQSLNDEARRLNDGVQSLNDEAQSLNGRAQNCNDRVRNIKGEVQRLNDEARNTMVRALRLSPSGAAPGSHISRPWRDDDCPSLRAG